jgi:hypothetical protein
MVDLRKGSMTVVALSPLPNRRLHLVPDEIDYLRSRMLIEIMAALHSQRPSVASVHIVLANLYAARIGSGASLLEDQAS